MHQLIMFQTATLRLTNSISRSPLRRVFFLIPVALALFAFAPAAQGGYPGINTAEGTNALQFLTTGTQNTALGGFSLSSDNTGNNNTAVGAGALFKDKANDNTATGAGALFNNTTGIQNTATGLAALATNTTADDNTATGFQALASNTGNGHGNTAVGSQALLSNTTIGVNSGFDNTAVGLLALFDNTIGHGNTAIGVQALQADTTGAVNTAVGQGALFHTTGNSNIALGSDAGFNIMTGNNNIDIYDPGVAADANTIRVGTQGTQTATFIAGITGVSEGGTVAVVTINGNGQLGTQLPVVSSRRFKKEIKPMDKASEAILGLKPVTFQLKSDSKGTPQFGLIAEEVAQVNPDLVMRDDKGEIYTVRYEAVNAMLLNEFLKEHRKVQEQEATISELKSTVAQQQEGMKVFAATLKEQDSKIQKVTDQLEVSKPATAVVVNE
ncbi:MAG: hypothetical protein DMF22_07480 [Verrucomicrobia bacterium]|nr:MAG: hypothetical protein DMF22_07480 [Verrucomicrobiota bacterium]